MDLSRSLFKRENLVGDIDLGVIKGYNWPSPEKVFIENKEDLGLNSEEHKHLRGEKPIAKAEKERPER